jgi:2-dehydropantoate 2-reductase
MKKNLHIALLGTGAVGVLPAAKFIEMEHIRLTAAADARRVARYRRDGIFFNGRKLPLEFACPEEMEKFPRADLIVIATKMPALAEALENIRPLVGENTILLPFLNGISASEVIKERFPDNTVLKGFFLGHASVRENNHITHDGVGVFYIGGVELAAVKFAEEIFRDAGIDVKVPGDIVSAMWKKFVLNVGVNQTQAVFKADYGAVQNSPVLLDYAKNLMLEAVLIAQAENVAGTESMVSDALKVIHEMPGNVKTSMLQDVLSDRVTEVDAFAGTICAKAARYHIPVPFNTEVLAKLKR